MSDFTETSQDVEAEIKRRLKACGAYHLEYWPEFSPDTRFAVWRIIAGMAEQFEGATIEEACERAGRAAP